MLRWSLTIGVAVLVMLATSNLLGNGGYGTVAVHEYAYYAIAALALAVPIFWAAGHVLMGILMGISGGGMKEGLRLGLMLGVGMALGRSWLNVAAIGAGMALAGAPQLWIWSALVLAAVLYALDWVIGYFWRKDQTPNAN